MNAQAKAIPIEVRNKVREWLAGTFGKDHPAVPLHLIDKVTIGTLPIYRIEIDITIVTTAPQRETIFLEVAYPSGGVPVIDPDSVVFFG